jgi:hypothetical protein
MPGLARGSSDIPELQSHHAAANRKIVLHDLKFLLALRPAFDLAPRETAAFMQIHWLLP